MTINILGFGNVGQHLYKAFLAKESIKVVQVYSRRKLEKFNNSTIPFVHSIAGLKEADVHIIAMPDDAIPGFSQQLNFTDSLVVHTSGSVPIHDISHTGRKGVFYALQTFSKEAPIDFASIPICIEATHKKDLKTLEELGEAISGKTVEINSEDRKKLHVAAVYVNNFVNHLYHISENYLNENQIDFDLLRPLITETAKKVQRISAKEAQTGPARRQDIDTIKKHLQMFGEESNLSEIYKIMTHSIIQTYKE